MARGRMLSKSLSTSEKFAGLLEHAGPLTEFAQLLFTMMVPHADDFGRLPGDPWTVKHICLPGSNRTVYEFAAALLALENVHLIDLYEVGGKQFACVLNFEKHQLGLHHRTKSTYPDPPSFPQAATNSGKIPEIPENSHATKENRTELKIPPIVPPYKGGHLTRQELATAELVLRHRHGRCHHDPPCPNTHTCVTAIAYETRQKRVAR